MQTYNDKFAQEMLNVPKEKRLISSSIDAGCTYIGQMISHDIVPPTSKINQPSRSSLSWALNLNSLYDDLKSNQKFENYEKKANGAYDFLRIRKEVENKIKYIAKIEEKRNDENAIISQLHIFWITLHNHIIDKYNVNSKKAREWVTLAFQLVVVHDFLHQILDKKVFKRYFLDNKTYLDKDFLTSFEANVPDFFRNASFRFGHSMVRSKYDLGGKNPRGTKLHKLFNRNSTFDINNKIDWQRFFYSQKALNIDTYISPLMGKVPQDASKSIEHIIPKLNLVASQNLFTVNLLSELKRRHNWNDIQKECGVEILEQSAMEKASFRNVEPDITRLSLWPYLLLEAQVLRKGAHLGPLGSILNAEVLKISIQRAEYSIYEKFNPEIYSLPKALSKMGRFGKDIEAQLGSLNQKPDFFDGKKKYSLMKTLINLNT